MNRRGRHVIKLGGSLLDMSDWPQRLLRFLARCDNDATGCEVDGGGGDVGGGGGVVGGRVVCVLLVGGGRTADLVRNWCAMHAIDDATGHDLAVEAMRFNAQMVAAVLRNMGDQCPWIKNASEWDAWSDLPLVIVDPVAWLVGSNVPQVWQFTSDSIAAHVATTIGADRLTLLKSALPSGGIGGAYPTENRGSHPGSYSGENTTVISGKHLGKNPRENSAGNPGKIPMAVSGKNTRTISQAIAEKIPKKNPGKNSGGIPGAPMANEKLSAVVDDWFLRTSADVPRVDLVNLRDDALPTWRLR